MRLDPFLDGDTLGTWSRRPLSRPGPVLPALWGGLTVSLFQILKAMHLIEAIHLINSSSV